ncbi:hypothetical protein [Planobispora longispora]|uniref:Uncharacterized protein n=1 Tax=Planobispora longispora TaxID=28887 RepID=A0A8J3RV55_9ACTN|nr:hypothetical protein [Planobispora longispora]BFE82205.1 hypothetical protein GCM10020093_048060 [Planobispora longispora]GIH78778.1 hypothetical protein Plo01_52070 [Planobispora longispora]
MNRRHRPRLLLDGGEPGAGKLPKRIPGEAKRRIDLLDAQEGEPHPDETDGGDRRDLPATA